MNAEDLVEAYINIRSKRDLLLQKYEKEDAELKSDIQKLEVALLEIGRAHV